MAYDKAQVKQRDFNFVFKRGWERMDELDRVNPSLGRLYRFFARHIGENVGAVVCDQQFLADHFEVSVRTIGRWSKELDEMGALVRIPVHGRVYAYALDPKEVWKGYAENKSSAAFITKTLTKYDTQVALKLTTMIKNERDLERAAA